MKQFYLTKPDKKNFNSYKKLVEEFIANKEELIPFPLTYPLGDPDKLFELFENDSKGIVKEGFVANTTFWLIDDRQEVIGVSNLRHYLNDGLKIIGGHIGYGIRPSCRRKGYGKEILKLTLEEARKINITQALITCHKKNIGSINVIKANGGQLQDEEYLESHSSIIQRYIITLS